MYFTHLPQAATWINRTHASFAGLPAADALRVLGDLNYQIMNSPVVGATYYARTNADHGYLPTLLYIGRDKRGFWEIIEQVDKGQS